METQLILSVGGFPPLSARGCVQELVPIDSGMLKRTINGQLLYLGNPSKMKYRSTIRCEDKNAMATQGLWRGSKVEVSCIVHLAQKVDGTHLILERDFVPGSLSAMTQKKKSIPIISAQGRNVVIAGVEEPVYVSYRPHLVMRVHNFSLTTNEWGVKTAWTLNLEEI